MKFIATPFAIEDIEKLKQAHADAVMISLASFSLRATAYFTLTDLPKIKALCVSLDMELYIQLNRFFYEQELTSLTKCMQILKDVDVDGIYFGDEGVLWIAQNLGMLDKMIYAPETLLTNSEDVNFYLEQGLHSVVLAKEITLEEVLLIAKHSQPQRLEMLIHGRLNMMHSKRHLLSNYLDFIGKDYQVKDKTSLYIMEETRDAHMPILEDESGTHVFSGYTLSCFEEITQLAQAEIGYVRIDGLFHDIDYVTFILQLYHAILSQAKTPAQATQLYKEKYPHDDSDKGFLYTKTSKLKQENE